MLVLLLWIKEDPKPGQSQVMNIVGNVKGKICVVVDDIIDSMELSKCSKALKDRGQRSLCLYTMGPSGDAVKKIKSSVIKNLVITDTPDNGKKLKVLKI